MTHDHTHQHTKRCFWAYDEARWVCRPAPGPRPERGDVDTLLAMLRDADRTPELVTT